MSVTVCRSMKKKYTHQLKLTEIMKKKIYAAAVMLFALAAPFVFTACDDDDEDTEESSSSSSSNSSSSDSTDDNSSSGSTSTTAGTAVDLGLSVKWASKNVGAALPADEGDAYAWGETESECDYLYALCSCDLNGVADIEDISGNTSYDAATANWGSKWRMPTYIEMQELIDDCTWTYTTQEDSNGEEVEGFLVTGSNDNSIFLPIAWYWSSSSDLTYYCDTAGDCAGNNSGKYAADLHIQSSVKYSVKCGLQRTCSILIRPVAD